MCDRAQEYRVDISTSAHIFRKSFNITLLSETHPLNQKVTTPSLCACVRACADGLEIFGVRCTMTVPAMSLYSTATSVCAVGQPSAQSDRRMVETKCQMKREDVMATVLREIM